MTVVSGKAASRKWNVLATVLFFAAAGCHMESHQRDGVNYVKVEMGLGVGDESGTVPNALEVDVPAMYAHIESPILTHVVKAAWLGSGSVLDWAVDGVADLLGMGK